MSNLQSQKLISDFQSQQTYCILCCIHHCITNRMNTYCSEEHINQHIVLKIGIPTIRCLCKFNVYISIKVRVVWVGWTRPLCHSCCIHDRQMDNLSLFYEENFKKLYYYKIIFLTIYSLSTKTKLFGTPK